ncbi:CheR family methyltransferase [Rubripirellula tenax]|uniref:CheR family methyltransferase n=1 Tax=Rubripirellula tenax TaxID=2528015 RepID=UPI0011B68B49|nr:protein-glutamate O-methyltransferase CheR [Rubripirellula tenax]
MIEARLGELVDRFHCGSYQELANQARSLMNDALRREIVDKMTTNETLFFRDRSPFEALQHKIIPHLIDAKEKTAYPTRLRIWSAGCSTGQEPYSIAMTLSEMIPDIHDWDISIFATDVSDDAIKTASTGVYAAHHVERGLPSQFREKYFQPSTGGWQVTDAIRSLIRFQRANLLEPFTGFGRFDVIFCRNVAIYFTPERRVDLFKRFADSLSADGYLFVGSAEAPSDLTHRFFPEDHCRSTVYRPHGSTSLT